MIINGKEYGFKLTVGASVKVASMCPNGDLAKLGEVMKGAYGKQADSIAKIVSYLNEGYVAAEKFAGRDANVLTVDGIMSLSPTEFTALSDEAFQAFVGDASGEIEVESEKKAGAEG